MKMSIQHKLFILLCPSVFTTLKNIRVKNPKTTYNLCEEKWFAHCRLVI